MIIVPARFAELSAQVFGPQGREWCGRLPGMVDEYAQRWNLTIDLPAGAEPRYGMCGIVVPVETAAGEPAVLKISWPDEETEHEHTALATWAGVGAVRLLAADGPRRALLLERLQPDVDLRSVPIDDAVVVVAELLAQLAVPAPPGIGTVADLAAYWAETMPSRWQAAGRPCEPRLLDEAVAVLRELGRDGGSAMIHTDLHYENVLATPAGRAPDRGRWLAIDPKPLIGDPAYGVLPTMWNRLEDLEGSDEGAALRRRLALFCDAAGIDADRARAWTMARAVETVIWNAEVSAAHEYQRPLWVAETFATS